MYPFTYLFGLRSIHSQGYEFEENVFEQNGTYASNGINIINSDYQDNRTYRNDFRSMEVGQLAEELNRDPANSSIGLQFLCNTNSSANEYDIVVNDGTSSGNGGVRIRQGRKNKSAGNIVSLNPTQVDGHFQNNSPNTVRYFFTNSAEEPTHYTSAMVLPTAANISHDCPVNYQSIGFEGEVGLAENSHSNFYQSLNQYHALLYNYHQIIDNGNTDSLVNAINMTVSTEAQELRDQLMSESPYLSEESIRSAAETGILSDAYLLEICLANPEATMNESFLDFVEFEIPNPLPASMVQLIYQNWDVETPRSLLEDELAAKGEDVELLLNQIIRHYQTDSTYHQDSIYHYIASRNRLNTKYKLIELNIESGHWEACSTLFADIEQQIELTDRQETEHLNFKAYVALRQSMADENKSYMQLNSDELNTLRTIAELESGRSSILAQNILCFGYHECYVAQEDPELRSKRSRVYDMNEVDEPNNSTQPNIILQPNPVKEVLQLKLNGYDLQQSKLILQIFSIEGKLLKDHAINQPLTNINMRNFENGTYLYRLFEGESQVEEGKVIVLH